MKKMKTIIILCVVAALIAGVMVFHYESRKMLVFSESLSETAVTVDEEKIPLRTLAFYIAYEEKSIEEQAKIYSPENTNSYWNLHIDGQFIQVAGKQAALDMAVHDTIFSKLATDGGIALEETDIQALDSKAGDFWADLSEEQKESLGVTEEELHQTMEKLALAQKYQTYLSAQSGSDYESYDIAGANYEKIKDEHKIVINKKVWGKIDFGNITVKH